MRRYRWVLAVCYLVVVDVAMAQSAPRLGVNTIAEVVAAMTPEDTLGNLAALDRWRAAAGLRYPADDASG